MKLATSLAPSALALAACSPVPDAPRALVPNTQIRLTVPSGHVSAPGETGYRWPDLDARLVVREVPFPYSTAARALANGVYPGLGPGSWLLGVEDVELGGRAAKIASFRQELPGTKRLVWLALVGDDERHCQIEASVVTRHADEFGPRLESALRGAEWDTSAELDRFAQVPWTFAPPEGLEFSLRMDGALAWTEGAVSRAAATVLVTTVEPLAHVDGPAALAAAIVTKAEGEKIGAEYTVESSQRADVAGHAGHETVVTETKAGVPPRVLVLHAIALDGGRHVLFRSGCESQERATWLPRFRAATASWRPKGKT